MKRYDSIYSKICVAHYLLKLQLIYTYLVLWRQEMNYRIGLPFWKLACKMGFTPSFRIIIHKDPKQNVYWCESNDLKEVISEMPSIEELIREVNNIAEELLEMNYNVKNCHTNFYIQNDISSLA